MWLLCLGQGPHLEQDKQVVWSRHNTQAAPCTALPAASRACKSKFTDRPPQSPKAVNTEPVFYPPSILPLLLGLPAPPPLTFIVKENKSKTAGLLCILREHRWRKEGPAFLWRTSPSLCCFWLQSSSHHSQHGEGDTGIPESFHLTFPPKKSPVYHSSAPNSTANFFFPPAI